MEPMMSPLALEVGPAETHCGYPALEEGVAEPHCGAAVTSEKNRSFHRTCFTVCGIAVCNVISRIVYGLVDEPGSIDMHVVFAIGRSAMVGALAFATHFAMWAGDGRRWLCLKTVVVWIVNGLLWAIVVADLVVLSFYGGVPLSFVFNPSLAEVLMDLNGLYLEAGTKIFGCVMVGQILAAGRVKSWKCTERILLFLIFVPVATLGTVRYLGLWGKVSDPPPISQTVGNVPMHDMPHLRWVWPGWLLVLLQCVYLSVFHGVIAAWVCRVRGHLRTLCVLAAVICVALEYWWVREFLRYSAPLPSGGIGGDFKNQNYTASKPESFIFFWSDSLPARDFWDGPNIPPDMQPLGPDFRDQVNKIMLGSKCTWIPHHFSSTVRTFDALNQMWHGYHARANGQYYPYPMAALRSAGYEVASWTSLGRSDDLNAKSYFTKWENGIPDEEIVEDFLRWITDVQAPFVAFVGFQETHCRYPNDVFKSRTLWFLEAVAKMIKAASAHDPLVFVGSDHGDAAKGLSPPPDHNVRTHGVAVLGHEGTELVSRIPLWICPSSGKPSQQSIVDAALAQPTTSNLDFMPTLLPYFGMQPLLDTAQWSSGKNWLEMSDNADHLVLSRFCAGGLDEFTVVSHCGYVNLGRTNVARFMHDGTPIDLGEDRRIPFWPWLCDNPDFDVTKMPSEQIWQFVQGTFATAAANRLHNFGEEGY